MIPVLGALAAQLAAQGLGLIGNAVLAKGKDVVEKTLGVDIEASLGTPEGKVRLMELQNEKERDLHAFVLAQREQELEADRMAYQDTSSARDMNTRVNESANATWLSKNIAAVLGLAVIVGGGVILYTTTEPDVRTAVVGLMTLVLGFYFGTSAGSRSKDDLVRTALESKR